MDVLREQSCPHRRFWVYLTTWANALMESTIGLYKTELVRRHRRTWSGAAELERETADWVHWFNSRRIHTSIGRVPPIEYEADYRKKLSASTGDVA